MERLPRGRHGLSPEYVAENQRGRLLSALTEVLFEMGYQRTTVAAIGRRAAVSKSDFYKLFESKDACFYAAYDAAVERIRAQLVAACAEHAAEDWAGRVCRVIDALLAFMAADRALASLVLGAGLQVGPGIRDRQRAAIASFVPYLSEGAPLAPGGSAIPPATAEAVIGGAATLVGRRVFLSPGQGLGELLPEVLEFVLTPYLGVAETRRIVSAR